MFRPVIYNSLSRRQHKFPSWYSFTAAAFGFGFGLSQLLRWRPQQCQQQRLLLVLFSQREQQQRLLPKLQQQWQRQPSKQQQQSKRLSGALSQSISLKWIKFQAC